MFYVYLIIHNPSKAIYVGYTKDLTERLMHHIQDTIYPRSGMKVDGNTPTTKRFNLKRMQ